MQTCRFLLLTLTRTCEISVVPYLVRSRTRSAGEILMWSVISYVWAVHEFSLFLASFSFPFHPVQIMFYSFSFRSRPFPLFVVLWRLRQDTKLSHIWSVHWPCKMLFTRNVSYSYSRRSRDILSLKTIKVIMSLLLIT